MRIAGACAPVWSAICKSTALLASWQVVDAFVHHMLYDSLLLDLGVCGLWGGALASFLVLAMVALLCFQRLASDHY
jgi:hypothetical protein